MPGKVPFLGFEVDAGELSDIVAAVTACVATSRERRWLACLNPHAYVVALQDQRFAAALRSADWLLPDGIGIVLAARLLGESINARVSGPDVFTALHQRLNDLGGMRIFFFGSTPQTLHLITRRIETELPNIRVAGTLSPPFKDHYSAEENDRMADLINQSRPDVLWVGLTAPKQEKWVHENRHRLNVSFIGAVGAAFDFFAGTVRRSPRVFREHGLDWLPRLIQQPRRLWRRTFVSAPIFLWHVLKARYSSRPQARD